MTAHIVIKIYSSEFTVPAPEPEYVARSVTPDSARGRALGGPTSFLFFGQFLSPIGPRSLAEVVGLTTAFVWVGAVMVVGVVSFGLAAVIMPPPAEPEPESDDGGLTDPTDRTTLTSSSVTFHPAS